MYDSELYTPSIRSHTNQRDLSRSADETANCTGCDTHCSLRSKIWRLAISSITNQTDKTAIHCDYRTHTYQLINVYKATALYTLMS